MLRCPLSLSPPTTHILLKPLFLGIRWSFFISVFSPLETICVSSFSTVTCVQIPTSFLESYFCFCMRQEDPYSWICFSNLIKHRPLTSLDPETCVLLSFLCYQWHCCTHSLLGTDWCWRHSARQRICFLLAVWPWIISVFHCVPLMKWRHLLLSGLLRCFIPLPFPVYICFLKGFIRGQW